MVRAWMKKAVQRRVSWPAIALAVGLAACGEDAPSGGALPPPPAGICPTDRLYDALSYDLTARFDWTSKRLVATERVALAIGEGGSRQIVLDSFVDVKRVYDADHDLPFVANAAGTLNIDTTSLALSEGAIAFSIEYEAPLTGALRASAGRDDDPVTSRVVYTDSEPLDGAFWLPANHRPCDRAAWSVELTVPGGEDVIANGEREKDEPSGSDRVVRYRIKEPIPTYTMAFAAGELEHEDATAGSVPIALWHRRGFVVDAPALLARTAKDVETFSTLLGPYRWSRYALVLLPEYSGGMENTTISFVDETGQQGYANGVVTAHELGHQWFGDWTTVRTFDDLWIKEGMAVVLAQEADRSRRDEGGTGRLFGTAFSFTPGQSIRDRSLAPSAKYNTGPYSRAAWLLAQIRAVVGESSFWESLRKVLADRALSSIDSESFLTFFALDDATRAKALASLDQKDGPTMTAPTNAAARSVAITLSDPAQTIIAPFGITVVGADGVATESKLQVGETLTVTVPDGGYLALDEKDVHPDWWQSFQMPTTDSAGISFWVPTSDAAFAAFTTRSAVHQERTFVRSSYLRMQPAQFPAIYDGLDSWYARERAVLTGLASQSRDSAWLSVLAPYLKAPAVARSSPRYGPAGVDFATKTFGDELAALAPHYGAASTARLHYLMSFDYGAATSFSILSTLALEAPSIVTREEAIRRLSYQPVMQYYSPLATADQTSFATFFRDRLQAAQSRTRFFLVWAGSYQLLDRDALAVAGAKLRSIAFTELDMQGIVCDAHFIAGTDGDASFATFSDAARPWTDLPDSVRARLQNPTLCDTVANALTEDGTAVQPTVTALHAPRPPASSLGEESLHGKY